MATLTADRADTGVQPYGGSTNEFCVAYGSYTFSSNPATNDVVELCKLPAGAVLVGGKAFCEVIDTDGTPTAAFELGTSDDTDKYLTSQTLDAEVDKDLTTTLLAAGPMTESTAVTVEAKMTTAATFQAGSMTVAIYYVMP